MSDQRYVRHSARVILVDALERVLLFSFYRDVRDPAKGEIWITPGGGIDDGEAVHHAAARELREETGLQVDADRLLPLVAYSHGYADLGWKEGVFRDDYFFHRVDAHEVDVTGQEEWESRSLTGSRWWTVDELRSTSEEIIPHRIADLVTELVQDGPPVEPLILKWHH